MTVSSSTNRVSYSGNGTLTAFAYTFKIFDEDDLTVILRASDGTETVQTITTHYTVSGVGDVGGGNVTFVTAPTATQTVVILREQPLTQGLDLVPNDPFPANSLEEALDKIVFMTQKHEEELGRAIKASRTNTITGAEFTISASDRANKVFAFDSSGDVSITQEIGTYRGNWATSTAYEVRDLVKDTSTNNIFIVNSAHTSSGSQPLTTNANSAKYDLIVDAAAATTSATNAASSAAAAATSATSASTAQTAAETAQTGAETAKTGAETAQTAAETAQAAAETAQAAAETAADNFDDTYLGSKSSDPTVDNDGGALNAGDLYFNTTSNNLKVYSGSAWQDAALDASSFIAASGGTLTGNLNYGDSVKAQFGAGNDLQIYHDGSNSYIDDAGTGGLIVRADNFYVRKANDIENMIIGSADGAVTLYHDNATKLATTSTGITVTGTAIATTDTDTTNSGSVTLDFGANQNFVLTLTGNVTLANPTTEQVGQSGFIVFIQDATGGRTVSLGTDYETAGGAGLTLSSAASTTDIVPYVVAASGRILLGTPQLAFA